MIDTILTILACIGAVAIIFSLIFFIEIYAAWLDGKYFIDDKNQVYKR